MVTETDLTKDADPGRQLVPVLDDLAAVVEGVRPEQFGDPTPCPAFDVAKLRSHILAWVQYFAVSLSDVEGNSDRLDPNVYTAPDDPAQAAGIVRTAARQIGAAVDDGVAERPITLLGSTLPGSVILGMTLGEYLVHGSDLAKSTGQRWDPPDAASECGMGALSGMLTDEYRGEGQSFGYQVKVADDATALDRLLGFAGRDPKWTAKT
jgi:uncharacterized protein (TIGR03086 family)